MNNPLVSIIVPCYKQAHYLSEALQSVLEQTYTNWECIIVNDGSPDNAERVAKKWMEKDSRFQYLYKENGGLSSARNAGIRCAKGTYILPLDADDKIHSTYLEKIVKVFSGNSALELVTSRIQFFGSSTKELKLPNYNYKRGLVRNCFVCTSAFKKVSWEEVGGYDENMQSFEDWEFWIRILNEKSRVYKIPEKMFFYRKHQSDSMSNSFKTNPEFYFSLYDYVYEKHKDLYKKHFPNPIIAYEENWNLKEFNQKVKNTIWFKLYTKIRRKR